MLDTKLVPAAVLKTELTVHTALPLGSALILSDLAVVPI